MKNIINVLIIKSIVIFGIIYFENEQTSNVLLKRKNQAT